MNQSTKKTDDPTWVKPINVPINVYVTSRPKTDTKRIGMKYEHFDKKKKMLLVELRVEREVPESFREEFNTIAYNKDFCGDVILDVKNEFKIKGGVKVSMRCEEYGRWELGRRLGSKKHLAAIRARTSYSREFHLLSDDSNRTFRQGEKVVLPFKFEDIIDAPSFYYTGNSGDTTCYVKWEFRVFLDLDYGNIFKNAFGRNVDFKCDCHHVGKYLSVSDPVNSHLGVPVEKNIWISVLSFMCCCSTGELEGHIWLERDHFSIADVRRNQALRSNLKMQFKNSSKKEICIMGYEFRKWISIDDHCFGGLGGAVSRSYFPQSSNLKPEMTSFENFNFQVSLVDQGVLSLMNQATSPHTNYARLEWKLVVLLDGLSDSTLNPNIVFPITLCTRFIA